MNLGTFVVALLLLLVVGGIIAGMARDKRNGKSLQCGCDCKDCKRHCH